MYYFLYSEEVTYSLSLLNSCPRDHLFKVLHSSYDLKKPDLVCKIPTLPLLQITKDLKACISMNSAEISLTMSSLIVIAAASSMDSATWVWRELQCLTNF